MSVEIMSDGARMTISVAGDIGIHDVEELSRRLSALEPAALVTFDLGALDRLDTSAAWVLVTQGDRMSGAGARVSVTGAPDHAASLIETVRRSLPGTHSAETTHVGVVDLIARLGRKVVEALAFVAALLGYLGLFLTRLAQAARHPRAFRLTATVHHCEEVGLRAVPIVALMAFLIGVVLAYQGAAQLRPFGAEIFVVDLIAISVLRELGIVLTAIIIAGRTASAFTAAIGSMKMREEIDAMRILGLDPAMALFVPRILALLITLPILGLVADVAGLLGGALMAWAELGISPAMFRTRLIEGTDVTHVAVGLIKAPVFALIIGLVGCHAGMQVESSVESLGRMTSNAVVTSIFAVIVADALFSVFFAQVGL